MQTHMESPKLTRFFNFMVYYYPKQWVSLLVTIVLLSLSGVLPLSIPFATIIARSWIYGPEQANTVALYESGGSTQTGAEDYLAKIKLTGCYVNMEHNGRLAVVLVFTQLPGGVIAPPFDSKSLLKGRIPGNSDDIAISWQVARELGVKKGDEILLSDNDVKRRLVVQGVYKPYHLAGHGPLWGYTTSFLSRNFYKGEGFCAETREASVFLPNDFDKEKAFSIVKGFFSADAVYTIILLSLLLVSVLLGAQAVWYFRFRQIKEWAILYAFGLNVRYMFFLEEIVAAFCALIAACLSVGLTVLIQDYYFAVLFPLDLQHVTQFITFYAIWGFITQSIVSVAFFVLKPSFMRDSLRVN